MTFCKNKHISIYILSVLTSNFLKNKNKVFLNYSKKYIITVAVKVKLRKFSSKQAFLGRSFFALNLVSYTCEKVFLKIGNFLTSGAFFLQHTVPGICTFQNQN
jgi:hypothetical protein